MLLCDRDPLQVFVALRRSGGGSCVYVFFLLFSLHLLLDIELLPPKQIFPYY